MILILTLNFNNLKKLYPSIPDKIIELFLLNDPSGKKLMYVKFMLKLYIEAPRPELIILLIVKYVTLNKYYAQKNKSNLIKSLNTFTTFDLFELYLNLNYKLISNTQNEVDYWRIDFSHDLLYIYKDSAIWFFRCKNYNITKFLFNGMTGIFKTDWCVAQDKRTFLAVDNKNLKFFAIIDKKNNKCYGFKAIVNKNKSQYYINYSTLKTKKISLEQYIALEGVYIGIYLYITDGIYPRIQGGGAYSLVEIMLMCNTTFNFKYIQISNKVEFKKILMSLVIENPMLIQYMKNKLLIYKYALTNKNSYISKYVTANKLADSNNLNEYILSEPYNLQYVPYSHITPLLCKRVIEQRPNLISIIPKLFLNLKLIKIAFELGAELYEIPNRYITRLMYMLRFLVNPSHIRYIPLKYITKLMVDIAVTSSSKNIQYIPDKFKTLLMYKMALSENNHELSYIPLKYTTQENWNLFVSKYPYHFDKVPKKFITQLMCNNMIKSAGYLLPIVPVNFRTPLFFNIAITSQNLSEEAIDIIPTEYKKFDFYIKIISNKSDVTESIPKKYWNLLLFCKRAFDIDPTIMKYIPLKYINQEMCNKVIEYKHGSLKYIPEKYINSKLIFNALTKHIFTIEYIPKYILNYKMCLLAVKNDEYALRHVPLKYRDYNMCKAAATTGLHALRYIPLLYKSLLICKSAIRHNKGEHDGFKNIPSKYLDDVFYLYAVKKNPKFFEHVPYSKRTLMLSRVAVSLDGYNLEFVPYKYRTINLSRLALNNKGSLQFVPYKYRNKLKKLLNNTIT